MIEAVIVLSTMLVFFGLILFVRKAYGAKLDLQQRTRSNVLYYASHGCTGSTGDTTSQTSENVAGDVREVDNVAAKSKEESGGAASRTWNTASATAATTVEWSTVWDVNPERKESSIDLQKQKLSRRIEAASKTTCNEKKYDSQWTAWMKFAGDFVSRGFGGVGDVFK